jgi:hypothetical protein
MLPILINKIANIIFITLVIILKLFFMSAEISVINRGVILILPKQPFYDWANNLTPGDTVNAEDFDEYSSYLITDDFTSSDKVMEKYYKEIFEEQLSGMWTDKRDWPQRRSFKQFKEWFTYYVSSMAIDLEKGKIIHEDC